MRDDMDAHNNLYTPKNAILILFLQYYFVVEQVGPSLPPRRPPNVYLTFRILIVALAVTWSSAQDILIKKCVFTPKIENNNREGNNFLRFSKKIISKGGDRTFNEYDFSNSNSSTLILIKP